MLEINTVLFLAVVVVGAVMQTITGFAMGLLIMVGVALFSLADIAFAAAVVSFISLANTCVALRSGYRHIDWVFVKWVLTGLVPAMILGIVLLNYLSAYYYDLLKLLLGVVVILAGTSLMIAPSSFSKRSGSVPLIACGSLGGLLAGLYSAGGAPLAYFAYRQPLSINVIRFSLLSVFAASTFIRTIMIAVAGQLDADIMRMSLIAIPLVVIVTLITSRFVHLVPDRVVRVSVFIVLIVAGGSLVSASLLSADFFHP